VVQFHLRDARTSAEDLDERLARYRTERGPLDRPAGALLFSCLGRGAWLYGVPDHDTDAFRRHIGPVPLGGFFCNGEIGPVERRTFLHGYTSAFGLFRPRAS
jgi:small ligand-binding sensory domain FIST